MSLIWCLYFLLLLLSVWCVEFDLSTIFGTSSTSINIHAYMYKWRNYFSFSHSGKLQMCMIIKIILWLICLGVLTARGTYCLARLNHSLCHVQSSHHHVFWYSLLSDWENINVITSHNVTLLPGRYLCDYTYYTSLYLGRGHSAFIHVPPLGKPYSSQDLGRALQAAVQEMLKLLELDHHDNKDCNHKHHHHQHDH